MKSLVLSGGGARGAYQVGVLNAISDISTELRIKNPFRIYTGVSAGAINAGFLASGADDFAVITRRLADFWSDLESGQVFKTDAISLGKIGLKWMGELSFGAITGATQGRALLDTSPLWELLKNNCDFSRIQKNIDQGHMQSVAVSAIDYKTSTTITFMQGDDSVPLWQRSRRSAERVLLKIEHVMASAAIPVLFPPVNVESRFFGDGCVRNLTPCSPAIHMGSDQLMVIGVRKQQETAYDKMLNASTMPPSVAKVMNMLLNAVLLDGIEVDIERLNRINEFLNRVPDSHQEKLNFKRVEHVFICPSEDIGQIAASMASRLPRVIRYLLKGLGPLEDASEIISYLMFEREFTTRLIEVGYKDGMAQKESIQEFLQK